MCYELCCTVARVGTYVLRQESKLNVFHLRSLRRSSASHGKAISPTKKSKQAHKFSVCFPCWPKNTCDGLAMSHTCWMAEIPRTSCMGNWPQAPDPGSILRYQDVRTSMWMTSHQQASKRWQQTAVPGDMPPDRQQVSRTEKRRAVGGKKTRQTRENWDGTLRRHYLCVQNMQQGLSLKPRIGLYRNSRRCSSATKWIKGAKLHCLPRQKESQQQNYMLVYQVNSHHILREKK